MTNPLPIPAPTPKDDIVPHQEKIEHIVDGKLDTYRAGDEQRRNAKFAVRGTATIAAPTAPGATYSQAEAQSAVAAINAIRAALTAAGITA